VAIKNRQSKENDNIGYRKRRKTKNKQVIVRALKCLIQKQMI